MQARFILIPHRNTGEESEPSVLYFLFSFPSHLATPWHLIFSWYLRGCFYPYWLSLCRPFYVPVNFTSTKAFCNHSTANVSLYISWCLLCFISNSCENSFPILCEVDSRAVFVLPVKIHFLIMWPPWALGDKSSTGYGPLGVLCLLGCLE